MEKIKNIVPFLLAIVILLVAMYPCADKFFPTVNTNQQQEYAQITTLHNYSDCMHYLDSCSPLCACACCAAPVTLALQITLVPPTHILPIDSTNTNYQVSVQDVDLYIWQPPKLG